MSTLTQNLPRLDIGLETANDRFKRGFNSWFWGSLFVATVAHFLIFAYWPSIKTEDISFTTEELAAVELPPEVEIPPPPQQIARPATPVVSTANIEEDITIAPTTFEDNPVESLPPPPSVSSAANDELSSFKAFTPDMVRPELKNRAEIARALERFYPPLLRDAGIGATVAVNFWIDETGKVFKHEVAQSSGYPAFDEAAGKVADLMQFSPAMNRDKPVRVVVAIPITFRVQ